MELRTVRDLSPRGLKILLRADLNVPLSAGQVAEDGRIRAVLPTVRWLEERGARVAVLSHLGRPDGKVVEELRMAPVAKRFGELLGTDVRALPECVGDEVARAVEGLPPGGVVVLENVRFHPEEEENDPAFARELAAPFDAFVNDAFATAHRAHASTVGVARFLPAYAGFLMEREVEVLSGIRDNPRRPYHILVGGKKARDKLGVLTDLLPRVDGFLIGGGVAFTFLAAQGHRVGKSVVDESLVDTIRALLRAAKERGTEIVLPEDLVVARELAANAETVVVPANAIPDGWMGLDIGPATVERFAGVVARAGTVVWTGPLGAFEHPPFAAGTAAVARALVSSPAFTVVGGGETGEAVEKLGLADRFGYVSTGGGATLDFLRGKSMPALEPLRAA
ncbi:MAG: phosphoglycerate kinase [Candidatus Bipolaricaulis sp.]|nr:phosphoglycerate kinase [Candidatus Bipolaricaulis sp.]HOD73007.1 phosphoglycerate kinase [Candidatus Bipolaricaulis anaerobius]HQM38227.1 phosphoglycerate kinase [Candidatus Bipolaricaulis anaerobius]